MTDKNLPLAANHTLMIEVLAELNVESGLTVEQYISSAVRDGNSSMFLSLRAGAQFIAAKDALINSPDMSGTQVNDLSDMSDSFSKHLEKIGYPNQRAYEDMRVAKAYMAIPAAQRKSFIAMGKYKAIKLSKLDPEQINALVESNPNAIDDFALMSRDELKKRIEALEASHDRMRDEKEILERQQKRTTKPGELAYNPRTFEVRHESAALEYASRIHVDALETMWDEVANEDANPQEKQLQEHAIGLAAAALLARAGALYERVSMALGNEMPIQPSGKYLLSDDEKQSLEASVAMVDANFSTKKKEREAERYADAPTRRGRPSGSKNKDKGAE